MKKWGFQKMQYKIEFFEKTEYLVKAIKKFFLKKTKYLANTYTSGGFSDKLPKRKRTKCIYIYIYI